MKKASIRDLHIRTSELVREASEGAVILIERRGEPVAELRPIAKKRSKRLPDLSEFCGSGYRHPQDVPLRAGGALHLATALEVGEQEVWTNDRHLLGAASHFGIVGRSA
jgi:prevent-host-death family protein